MPDVLRTRCFLTTTAQRILRRDNIRFAPTERTIVDGVRPHVIRAQDPVRLQVPLSGNDEGVKGAIAVVRTILDLPEVRIWPCSGYWIQDVGICDGLQIRALVSCIGESSRNVLRQILLQGD